MRKNGSGWKPLRDRGVRAVVSLRARCAVKVIIPFIEQMLGRISMDVRQF